LGGGDLGPDAFAICAIHAWPDFPGLKGCRAVDLRGQSHAPSGVGIDEPRIDRATFGIDRFVFGGNHDLATDRNNAALVDEDRAVFDRLAIADPRLAPYGAAAVQTLRALGLYERLQPRLVTGENITQAHQFVATGNAPLGFVALSQVHVDGRIAEGSAWLVPARLHEPIVQQAVLLNPGRDSPAAAAFIGLLRSEPVRAVIRGAGYDTPPE